MTTNQPPTIPPFDFSTLTFAEALPWFRGAGIVLIGAVFSGLGVLLEFPGWAIPDSFDPSDGWYSSSQGSLA